MVWYLVAIIFIFSCFILSWISSYLVKDLILIAKYLRLKEFIIAFFIMAFATSLPNFFVDLNAAIQGKPTLAFGDIIGGNIIDLTLALAIAVFFSKKGISAQSEIVQKSALFTTIIAVLPLFLIFDGKLNRIDGLLLIFSFFIYCYWIFSKKGRFAKNYENKNENIVYQFGGFVKNIFMVIVLIILLLITSFVVIFSAQFFANKLDISLGLVGILIVGFGNAFPEIYFSIISAKKEENWLILGDLMGSVIVCSTLVLGLLAFLFPFKINDFSPFVTARIFLIIAVVLSLIFIRTGQKITKKGGLWLLFLYLAFLLVEVFIARQM